VRTAWSQIAFTLANVVIAAVGTALVALASTRGAVTVSDFIMLTVAVTSVQARNFGYPVLAADRTKWCVWRHALFERTGATSAPSRGGAN
jgi:hypothetical protein